jgi:DNA repair protein RadC
MGEAKTAQLKAALEIDARLLVTTGDIRPTSNTPEDVANLLSAEMALLN